MKNQLLPKFYKILYNKFSLFNGLKFNFLKSCQNPLRQKIEKFRIRQRSQKLIFDIKSISKEDKNHCDTLIKKNFLLLINKKLFTSVNNNVG
jgi:hypothetical protein